MGQGRAEWGLLHSDRTGGASELMQSGLPRYGRALHASELAVQSTNGAPSTPRSSPFYGQSPPTVDIFLLAASNVGWDRQTVGVEQGQEKQ